MTDYMKRVRDHVEDNQCSPKDSQHVGPSEVILISEKPQQLTSGGKRTKYARPAGSPDLQNPEQ